MYGDEIETEINVIWTKTIQKLQKWLFIKGSIRKLRIFLSILVQSHLSSIHPRSREHRKTWNDNSLVNRYSRISVRNNAYLKAFPRYQFVKKKKWLDRDDSWFDEKKGLERRTNTIEKKKKEWWPRQVRNSRRKFKERGLIKRELCWCLPQKPLAQALCVYLQTPQYEGTIRWNVLTPPKCSPKRSQGQRFQRPHYSFLVKGQRWN